MQSANKIILASAGSGKTTALVTDASADTSNRAALITYTLNGREELTKKAYRLFGAIPPHLTINTWYGFVLTHFVRPYQNHLYSPRVKGINFNRVPDSLRNIPKSATAKYFFSSRGLIWRDRVTDFACQVIEKTGGLPLWRLERIFGRLYIDEAQDLSGWDLELVEHLLSSKVQVFLTGDHRQATFSTNDNPKNKAYWGEKIIKKFEEWEAVNLASIEHAAHSHRCNQTICDFADKVFPDCPKTTSLNAEVTAHDGLYFVKQSLVSSYMSQFAPQPLRYNRTRKVTLGEPLNFGEAKGMTFDRTLIYPHGPFEKYLNTGKLCDAGKELAKIYVSITRARASVGFVVPDNFKSTILQYYVPSQ